MKITDKTKTEIKQRFINELITKKQLAREYRLHYQTICNITRGLVKKVKHPIHCAVSIDTLKQIRADRSAGMSYSKIAEKYYIGYQTAIDYCNGWKHNRRVTKKEA